MFTYSRINPQFLVITRQGENKRSLISLDEVKSIDECSSGSLVHLKDGGTVYAVENSIDNLIEAISTTQSLI